MVKQLPYEPTTHTVPPGRFYVGYDLTLKCKSIDCEDEAVGIVRALVSRGARIVRYMLSIPSGGFRSAFVIIDATGKKKGYAREMLDFLKSLDVVEEADFSPRYRNIIFTRALGPVLIAGKRSMINSLEYARGIAVRLYSRLGRNLAPLVINALGEEVGKSLAEGYAGIVNPSLKDIGEFVRHIMVASHHCSEAVVIAGEKSMSIRLKELWEDLVLRESGLVNESCNFMMGLIKGFLETLLKKRVEVREVMSERRKGAHTEFIVKIL